jgi:hypothetical protein
MTEERNGVSELGIRSHPDRLLSDSALGVGSHCQLTRPLWFNLPMKTRRAFWRETNYGKWQTLENWLLERKLRGINDKTLQT